MTPKLTPIGAVRPSTYNPRSASEDRLALVGLSLRKLGFVLPIFADQDGELISGHQRHHVATRLGWSEVPVVFVKTEDLAQRKALNIVFNRATNDMRVHEHSAALSRDLAAKEVSRLADMLPDAIDRCRCLSAAPVPVSELTADARPRYDAHMRNTARALWTRHRIVMPVVATPSRRIVNGLGRVQYASESGWATLPVVTVSEAEADFAAAMLNLLSMDFDIHRRYADLLRHNSFRRARTTRKALGTGFTFKVHSGTTTEFDVRAPANAKRWKQVYGTRVVDFGAGHLYETELLRSIGVHVAAFEPYRLGDGDTIDKAASVALARSFLRDVAAGDRFDSVFVSSVFNSVPFREDRETIVAICAALCGSGTFYANAMSTKHENWTSVNGQEKFSERRSQTATFALDYEGGIILGDYMAKPKVQKYHTARELYDLLKTGFAVANVESRGWNLIGVARQPIVCADRLRKAIETEFDLPYPDGSRMGLVREAREAFGRRLDMDL